MDPQPPPSAPATPTCLICGGPLLQKPRLRLLLVGVGLLGVAALGFVVRWFVAPGIVLALTGAYLVAWATLGRGRWCRNCKIFSLR